MVTETATPVTGMIAPNALANKDSRAQDALEILKREIAALHSSGDFLAYLTFQAKFYRYSWRNSLLIKVQCPHATWVAGYRKWESMGRCPRKGSKACWIYAPMSVLRKKDEDGEEQRVTLFKLVPVFDISMTDVVDAAKWAKYETQVQGARVCLLTGDEGADLYAVLEQIAADEGLHVQTTDDQGWTDAQGWYDRSRALIYVRGENAPLQRTKTFVHELAHHFAGHDGSGPDRDVKECVAEGAAFVVLHTLGFDSGSYSFPYVAQWAADQDTFRKALASLQKTALTVIEKVHAIVGVVTEPDTEDAA